MLIQFITVVCVCVCVRACVTGVCVRTCLRVIQTEQLDRQCDCPALIESCQPAHMNMHNHGRHLILIPTPILIYIYIYTLLKKIKGTLKQHNVTPSQSHFCEIKLSTQEATLNDKCHMLLCKWNRQQVEIIGNQQDTPNKGVVLQVGTTDHFSVPMLPG